MNGLSRWKIAVYLACIFAAGGVSGWVISSKTTRQNMLVPPKQEEIAASMRERCRAKLTHLTPDQEKGLDTIITNATREIKALHEMHVGRIRQVISNRNSEILAILTPEQQQQFELMEKERRESRWNHDRKKDRDRKYDREDKPPGTRETNRSCSRDK